jgi:hypothetical protein
MYKYLGTFLFISDLYSQKCTSTLEHFFLFQTYIRKNVQVPWNISFYFRLYSQKCSSTLEHFFSFQTARKKNYKQDRAQSTETLLIIFYKKKLLAVESQQVFKKSLYPTVHTYHGRMPSIYRRTVGKKQDVPLYESHSNNFLYL